jgi:hypothetical protein
MRKARWIFVALVPVVASGLGLWSWAQSASGITITWSCSGMLGSASLGPASGDLNSDQTHQMSLAMKQAGGGCTLSGLASPKSTTLFPSSLTINHVSGTLVGRGSCANTPAAEAVDANAANAYPPSGVLSMVFNEVNPTTHARYTSKMFVTVAGFSLAGADVVQLSGIVTGGVGQGMHLTWNTFMDPVNPNTHLFDAAALLACADNIPGNAAIKTLMVGDGTSPAGHLADGLTVYPCPPTSTTC